MNEITVKIEHEDITFKVVVEAEIDGNDIIFDILCVADEVGNILQDTCHICCLPEHWRTLDMEEIASLPKVKDVIAHFDSREGKMSVYTALEEYQQGHEADNFYLED